MSSDLISLSQILEGYSQVVLNADVLLSSANSVAKERAGANWAYEMAEMRVLVDVPQNSLPATCHGQLKLKIDLDLEGTCEIDSPDPLSRLVMNLFIESDSGTNICAWHFDRHIVGHVPSTESHPLYHFQHGGHAMKPHAASMGNSLLLPAPRLAFPPMDAVLAIDFVLSNFAGTCWQALRDDDAYLRMLRDAQMRYWKPYLEKLASWWAAGPKDESVTALWPHLA